MKTVITTIFLILSCISYSQRVVTNTVIESKNGIRYVKGENQPYSGTLEVYFKNGKKEAEAILIDGKFNGEGIDYYENGNKRSFMVYKNDIPHGDFIVWNENGNLVFTGIFKDEMLYKGSKPFSGGIKNYYLNGQLQEERRFKKGKRQGYWIYWSRDGKLINKKFYDNDKLIENKTSKTVYKDELRFENGIYYMKSANTPFTGKCLTNYPNGEIESVSCIKNGEQSGKMKIYFDSGKKLAILYEDENHVNYGKIKLWHENGKLSFRGYFIDGKLYKSGEDKPFNGTIIGKYANSNKYEEGNFKDGYWHGNHTRWDRNGNIIFKCVFENNKIIDCPIYNKK